MCRDIIISEGPPDVVGKSLKELSDSDKHSLAVWLRLQVEQARLRVAARLSNLKFLKMRK